ANGRMILVAGSFERTTPGTGRSDVLLSASLTSFVGNSLAWLARTSPPDLDRIEREPPTKPLHIEPLKPTDRQTFLPVGMQFTPLPHDGLPPPDSYPTRQAALRRMIDNMIDHGITTLH